MTPPFRRWKRRNPVVLLFLTLLFLGGCSSYLNDVSSCLRTQHTRQTQTHNLGVIRHVLATNGVSHRDLSRLERPDVPDCFPFPQT